MKKEWTVPTEGRAEPVWNIPKEVAQALAGRLRQRREQESSPVVRWARLLDVIDR